MKIIKIDNDEYKKWKSYIDLSKIKIIDNNNKSTLKIVYLLLKYSNLLFSDYSMEIKFKIGIIYITVYKNDINIDSNENYYTINAQSINNVCTNSISNIKDFFVFSDFNTAIVNNKLYIPETKNDIINFDRIRKFSRLESIKNI